MKHLDVREFLAANTQLPPSLPPLCAIQDTEKEVNTNYNGIKPEYKAVIIWPTNVIIQIFI